MVAVDKSGLYSRQSAVVSLKQVIDVRCDGTVALTNPGGLKTPGGSNR
jgi:hypothetical protein